MKHIVWLVGLFLLLTIVFPLNAQVRQPNFITACKIDSPLIFDGFLKENAWKRADHIKQFTQRELNCGQPCTERTEVAVIFDENNLYIGVWCYDSEAQKIIAQGMKYDFKYEKDDNFKIVLDTYLDRRNGYLFVTNPNGARFDALIQDNGQQVNESWNGVWDVRTRVTSQGWFAEFKIPFSTLKFKPQKELIWGINFERNIRRKREQDLWQGWSRDAELEQVARAGKLVGLTGIENISLVEVKPYALTGVQVESSAKNKNVFNLGGDLNYLITPTMKMNITLNTDFAQVESDYQQVNLTRFSQFYPEKREFFLEGSQYFDFGLGHSIQPFYSRRIGLAPDNSTEIKILGGMRLLGKAGHSTLGGMSIQTAPKDSIPATNYTVLRWKQDVLKESTIGIIGVGKLQKDHQNFVYGTDFLYSTSDFLGGKTLMMGGAVAQSFTPGVRHKIGWAHRLFIDLPNDFIDFSSIWDRSTAHFNPETGYLRRENYQMFNADLRIKPRPEFLPFIQKLEFKPFDFNYYINDQTHELETLWSEFRPLGFTTKSGEFFEANFQRRAEKLVKPFPIHPGVEIPAGEYWFSRYELQFGTFSGRPVYAFLFYQWGDYFSGQRTEWFIRSVFKFNRFLSLSCDYTQNVIHLPQGHFTVNEAAGRLEIAASPNLFGALFGQWNSDDKEMILNFRLNWIPQLGSNFYFVVNQTLDTAHHGFKLKNTTVLSKFVWRFVL